jgi:hypothetical protein
LLPDNPDLVHTNLGWVDGALVGQDVPDAPPAALRLADLTLVVGDESLPLSGLTYEEGRRWLFERYGTEVRRGEHVLPPHAIEDGAVFTADASHLEELARWFGMGHRVLTALASELTGTPSVRVWPHHFDVGLLHAQPGEGRSIGVGMSPGDDSYDQPYFYVYPWPNPAERVGPELAVGHWHTEGWFGAVATATALGGDAETAAADFVRAAYAAAVELLP